MFSPHLNNISNTASLTSPSADSAATVPHAVARRELAGNHRSLSLYPLFLSAREPASARGELVALKETDMDFNGRFICVQKESLLGNIGATKNGKARNVDMSTQLAEVISDVSSKPGRSPAAESRSWQKNAGTRPQW